MKTLDEFDIESVLNKVMFGSVIVSSTRTVSDYLYRFENKYTVFREM